MFRFGTRLGYLALGALAVASMAFVACGDDDDDTATATKPAAASSAAATATKPAASGPSADVKAAIGDNTFPASVTVAKGGKVTWDWAGSKNPHSVIGTSDNAKTLLSSPTNRDGKGAYTVTFAAAGTYDYECGVHGASMAGKVVVQ